MIKRIGVCGQDAGKTFFARITADIEISHRIVKLKSHPEKRGGREMKQVETSPKNGLLFF